MILKQVIVGITAAFTMLSLTACGKGDVSFSDKPEVMACRIIDAVVSNSEDDYLAVYPESVESMYGNYEYLHNLYGLRCRKFNIDYTGEHSYTETELCEFSNEDENGKISYYAYRDGQSVLHIVVGFDTAKNGYVIEEMRATKPDSNSSTSQSLKDNNYPFVDTESVDIE